MSDKQKVIETACDLAESSFVAPMELMGMLKEFSKHNITKDDFLRILSENPNEAILRKVVKWVPKNLFSNTDLEFCLRREDYKLTLFAKYNDIYKVDKSIKEKLSKGFFTSWEFLEHYIENL